MSSWTNFFIAGFAGIIGFIASGFNPYVGMLTFSLVAGVASYINPVTPDVDSPGQPQIGQLHIATASEGTIIPDVLGTIKTTGNIFYFFGDRNEEVMTEVEGGKGGASGEEFLSGYKYFCSWLVGICLGPVDTLYAVYAGDTLVWAGELDCPASGGEETITLGNLEPELTGKEVTHHHDVTHVCEHSGSTIKVVTQPPDPWLDATGESALTPYGVEYISGTISADWYDATNEFLYTKTAVILNRTFSLLAPCASMADALMGINNLTVNSDPFSDSAYQYKNAQLHLVFRYEYDESETATSMGSMTFYFGTDDQVANSTVGGSLADGTLNPAYRGLCYAFFNDNYIGRNNGAPTMRFVVGKRPKYAFSALESINAYDYNIAHAIYHILVNDMHLGLGTDLIGNATFAQVAATLSGEGRGISALIGTQQSASTYIEAFLLHGGGMLTSSSDE